MDTKLDRNNKTSTAQHSGVSVHDLYTIGRTGRTSQQKDKKIDCHDLISLCCNHVLKYCAMSYFRTYIYYMSIKIA